MSSSSSPQFPKLNSHNYNTWSGEMQAWLRAQGVWRIVAATSLAPKLPAPVFTCYGEVSPLSQVYRAPKTALENVYVIFGP
jgi:hypothetical protein